MSEEPAAADLLILTAEIVAAHVGKNPVTVADLPSLIRDVHGALAGLGRAMPVEARPAATARPAPAVSIKKSVASDHIVCLEDGLKLKMLKRHLRTAHGLSLAEYRERWGLAADYPMVAPNYAKRRSDLAKSIGLGTSRTAKKKR